MAHPASPAQVITDFYAAFARRDAEAMVALYAPGATFTDPAFGRLQGDDVAAMWRMLVGRAGELQVSLRDDLVTEGNVASVTWDARYRFGKRRFVHNVVHARMVVVEGRIAEHRDRFNMWRWSAQALGPAGWLLGWTPVVGAQVRRTARAQLAEFTSGR